MTSHAPFAFALCILAAIPGLGGIRIRMEHTDLATNKVEVTEMLIDNDRLRTNQGSTSMIFLTRGGNRMLILDKARNEYQEIDQAAMDQMTEMMAGAMAQMEAAMKGMPPEQRAMMEKMLKGKMPVAAPASAPLVYAARGTATVNGFRCTNYDGTQAGQKVAEVCAAQPGEIKLPAADYQVFEKMQQFLSGLMKAYENSPLSGMFAGAAAAKGVDGFPVRSVEFENGKAASRLELKEIMNAAFTEADFSTGNAKKTELPGANTRKGKR
jgi:hypothetical protein